MLKIRNKKNAEILKYIEDEINVLDNKINIYLKAPPGTEVKFYVYTFDTDYAMRALTYIKEKLVRKYNYSHYEMDANEISKLIKKTHIAMSKMDPDMVWVEKEPEKAARVRDRYGGKDDYWYDIYSKYL